MSIFYTMIMNFIVLKHHDIPNWFLSDWTYIYIDFYHDHGFHCMIHHDFHTWFLSDWTLVLFSTLALSSFLSARDPGRNRTDDISSRSFCSLLPMMHQLKH